ncbi:TOM1-like protein 2 isoform X5 [Orcinus orca]|uniref:TOM1-like protein 2 isoform X3 n=1 Tax=Tursiops truncatus TaxID=9739 RepID=A0A6J3QQC2_TURTR|nr:TOM1-like protein 2 isoform X5 [Orcinus orca]XP_033704228.1 TOM1-like protein 2 isoform X3 [Tursiops truncatus]XP_059853714.1 TOM1-like protein 2 isoform X6 [Delphinus delphis]
MEFLLGNPFSTPVGQCLEKATDGSLQSEDWTLNMEICDIINETEEGPKDAIRALKKRLNGNRNYREVMLALTVLETCVKNCGHRFHVLVANRDFIDGVLVKIISPKSNPPTIVQDKVLALIQAWADAFRSSPDLTGVVHAYEELKRKGMEFPMADLDALSPIHTPQRSVPEVDPATSMPKSQSQLQPRTSSGSSLVPQAPALSAAGPITANSEQIARLRSELDVVRGNTKVMSEMLTEMVPGQEDSSDLELLQELHRTCRAMQQRVVELISRVCNEEVTEELLHVNDDLNNVFLRYERFERYRSGRSVQNASNGVLSEVTEDNLIDLGPGSPAVVSPTVGGTVPPSSLSSQLAGLDLGAESVSGTLSSLQQCHPRDGFDMFAQTRGSSSAEQRKTATYEDPQAVGVIASAVDGRKQNPEVKGDDLEEGVTSEEFDKFLEERAKAAEMVPNLPSPPAEAPAPASNPSSRKKPEQSEDALFAL